ncbi:murein biosynthesis integral membrane protein MurJ [Anaerolineales bacterium HSG24]|nr:murein biosynthesis integral membrane protein MurJ [Anaerolineales bacterium HSG24]
MTHLIRSTSILMVAFFINKLLAVGRQIIIAPTFGTGREFDAFVAAFRLPDILYMMISGGALATAFIPVLSERLTISPAHDPHGWRLVSAVVNNMLLVALTVSLVVMIFADPIVTYIIASGFDPATQQLTVSMMRLVLISTTIFSISGLVGAVLNTHNHFVLPALAPIIYNLGIIGGALFLVEQFGVYGLIWGTIAGALGHLLIQLPGLAYFVWRNQSGGQSPSGPVPFTLGWHDPSLFEIIRLMGPRIVTIFVIQLNFIIMFNLASYLNEGSVSALDYGWDLMQMPQTIIGTAIGIVLFPTMSTLAARQDWVGLWQTTAQAMRVMLTLSIPAMVGLIALGRPIIKLMFERGEFDAASTALVYYALMFWSIALVAHCLMEVVNRFFYAQKDTITPLISSVLSMLLNLGLAYLLYQPLGVGGLALSNGVAVSLEILFLLTIIRFRQTTRVEPVETITHRQLGPINMTPLLKVLGQTLLAAGIMGVVVSLSFNHLNQLSLIWNISLSGLLGMLIYGLVGLAIGIDEIRVLPRLVKRENI